MEFLQGFPIPPTPFHWESSAISDDGAEKGDLEKLLFRHETHFPVDAGKSNQVRVQKTGVIGGHDEGAGSGDIFDAETFGIKKKADQPSGGESQLGKGRQFNPSGIELSEEFEVRRSK